MSTIETRVLIENLGQVPADRLREGEWVIIGNSVMSLAGAEFIEIAGRRMIELHFRTIRRVGSDLAREVEEHTQVVVPRHMFAVVNVTV